MHTMSEGKYKAFLMERPRTMTLVTVRADGHPHVVPVRFTLDGGTTISTVDGASAKAADLLRYPRVTSTRIIAHAGIAE